MSKVYKKLISFMELENVVWECKNCESQSCKKEDCPIWKRLQTLKTVGL